MKYRYVNSFVTRSVWPDNQYTQQSGRTRAEIGCKAWRINQSNQSNGSSSPIKIRGRKRTPGRGVTQKKNKTIHSIPPPVPVHRQQHAHNTTRSRTTFTWITHSKRNTCRSTTVRYEHQTTSNLEALIFTSRRPISPRAQSYHTKH